ncbi:MAG TPA: hypothetical protein VF586_01535 [Pyrinomonadaceae bacterium]|jgi:hypothetical protein
MNKLRPCLLLACVLLATGCPNGPSKDFNNDNFAARVNAFLAAEQRDYIDNVTSNPREARRVRNDMIDKALAVIDSNYNDYITRLQTRRSTTDFLADVIELGTGAAAGIAKGERPNQILGIALTAFRGGRRSAELNFYREQTTPILIAKMDDNRSKVQALILTHQGREVGEYSMNAAIRDIVAYYNAGTLVRAFTELAKDTSNSARESEEAVRVLRGDPEISDIPSLKEAQTADDLQWQRESLESQFRAADAEAKAVPTPTPLPTAPPPTPADTLAFNTAQTAAETRKAEKLKPVTEKLASIWKEVAAQPVFAAAVADLKAGGASQSILAKLDANPPQAVTAPEYFTLIRLLVAEIEDNRPANERLLDIMRRINK